MAQYRDYRLEWFRVFLAFEVVLCHCIGQSGYPMQWLSRLTLTCVDGFVLISGFFGIKFACKKVIALYGVGLYCAVVTSGFGRNMGLGCVWATLQDYWFLHAYVMLMLVSPVVNAMFDEVGVLPWPSNRFLIGKCAPLLCLVFGWNFIAGVGGVGAYAFVVPGMGSHSFITLLGVYVVGRLIRKTSVLNVIPSNVIIVMLVVSLGLMATGCLAVYSSPVCLIASVCLFALFQRHAPNNELVRWIAPSTLSIYLLHESPLMIERRYVLMSSIVPWCGVLPAYIILAILIFIIALTGWLIDGRNHDSRTRYCGFSGPR